MSEPPSKSKTRSLLRAVGIEEGEADESGRRRGIYLLPNLITTGALFAGFYAIVAAMNGHFMPAAVAIYAASILDAVDGRVARLTRTQSAFGAEYDSLSDMVAFGVAPALVAFSWALSALGQIGWVVTFIYMACAALRLARFNTQGESRTFTGLASPSAAVLIASLVWVLDEQRLAGETVSVLAAATLAVATTLMGILMVSNFTYFSPKLIPFRGRVPFFALVAVVLVFAIILADPPRVLLTLSGLYALSGVATYVWNLTRKPDPDPDLDPDPDPDLE